MTYIPSLFDKKGNFVLPSADVLDTIKPEIKAHIIGIGAAAQEVVDADANVTVAHQTIRDAQTTLNEAIAADRRRPAVTATSAAKDWIASQRAEAARQRQ